MKKSAKECAIFVAGAIAGALIESVLDEPLHKVRQSVLAPSWSYICGTEFRYREGGELLLAAKALAEDPTVEKTEEWKSEVDEMHADAMKSMEHAAWCGSKDAIKILVMARCQGIYGYAEDRQAGLALIRSELTNEHEMPSEATIQELCPRGDG
ncbi:hypothetical protein ACRARE_22440 [Pseudooceanicola sp. 200-1SW]